MASSATASRYCRASTAMAQKANKNALTKHFGKGLIIASGAMTILTWLIPTIGFKHNPNTVKTKVDTNKEQEVC